MTQGPDEEHPPLAWALSPVTLMLVGSLLLAVGSVTPWTEFFGYGWPYAAGGLSIYSSGLSLAMGLLLLLIGSSGIILGLASLMTAWRWPPAVPLVMLIAASACIAWGLIEADQSAYFETTDSGWIYVKVIPVGPGAAVLGAGLLAASWMRRERVSPPRTLPAHHQGAHGDAGLGPCPQCGELLPLAAQFCSFCGLDLVEYDEDLLQEPEDAARPQSRQQPTSNPLPFDAALEQLTRMRNAGLITESEHQAKRQEILDRL